MSSSPTERGAAALLAGLPGMGPHRLTALLDAWPPEEAWRRAISGNPRALPAPGDEPPHEPGRPVDPALLAVWAAAGAGRDPQVEAERHAAASVTVLLRHDPTYPGALATDVEPPAVLFVRGALDALDRGPRVALVGTRRCTGTGAGVARELGRDLAGAGVHVVSGLALGIDGAAHRGALDGSGGAPIGVVGSGLDVVYPARHRELWHAVAERGVLLGEAPLGARPAAWRFPARNRIIAALAEVVVVVESHAAGGSLLTVTEAIRRDVPVMAVPGSVRNPAAAGVNQLLADGCHPVRDATDVLVALGLSTAARGEVADRRPPPDDDGAVLLDAFAWEPATLDHLAVRTGFGLGRLTVGLERLVATGWVRAEGAWYERVAAG